MLSFLHQKWGYPLETLAGMAYGTKSGREIAMEAIEMFVAVPFKFHESIVWKIHGEQGAIIHKEIKAELPEKGMNVWCYQVNSILPNQSQVEKS